MTDSFVGRLYESCQSGVCTGGDLQQSASVTSEDQSSCSSGLVAFSEIMRAEEILLER